MMDFLSQCLSKNSELRATAEDLLLHPWIRDTVDKIGHNGCRLIKEHNMKRKFSEKIYRPYIRIFIRLCICIHTYIRIHTYNAAYKECCTIGRGVRVLRDLTDTYSDEVERMRARKFRFPNSHIHNPLKISISKHKYVCINAYIAIAMLLEIWRRSWKSPLSHWKSWPNNCQTVGEYVSVRTHECMYVCMY